MSLLDCLLMPDFILTFKKMQVLFVVFFRFFLHEAGWFLKGANTGQICDYMSTNLS
jgi:hypothetical protein